MYFVSRFMYKDIINSLNFQKSEAKPAQSRKRVYAVTTKNKHTTFENSYRDKFDKGMGYWKARIKTIEPDISLSDKYKVCENIDSVKESLDTVNLIKSIYELKCYVAYLLDKNTDNGQEFEESQDPGFNSLLHRSIHYK